MAWTKKGKLKERRKRQQSYLDYYRKRAKGYKRTRSKGDLPLTMYQWRKAGKTKGSRQLKRQMQGLSQSDYQEISKFIRK